MLWCEQPPHAYNSGYPLSFLTLFFANRSELRGWTSCIRASSFSTSARSSRNSSRAACASCRSTRKSCRSTPRSTSSARKQPIGLILSGGPKSVSEQDAPKCDPKVFEMGLPTLGHLLRHAADDGHAGRASRAVAASRVRLRRGHGGQRRQSAPVSRAAGRSAGLGEPRRFRRRRATGLRGRRHERQCTGRRDGGARARLLRAAVPSGSRAHRTRQGNPAELRLRRLRLHG